VDACAASRFAINRLSGSLTRGTPNTTLPTLSLFLCVKSPEMSVKQNPTVYVMDKFHPAVLKYAKDNFHAITPDMSEHSEWRQKARYLLMRSSRLSGRGCRIFPES
jgi:hypothetical protein